MKGGDWHLGMVTHVLDSMNEVVTNNYDSDHKAIDIVASDRSEPNIIALENGTVTTVVNNVKGTNHKSKGLATYGNFVKVKQDDGKTALYAHMKYGSVKVNKGEYIDKGTVIGTIGETGNAYGKHLHLEIKNENNIKENPLNTLNETNTSNKLDENNVQKNKITEEHSSTSNSSVKNHTNSTTTNNPTKQNNQISNDYNPNHTEYLNASNYHHGSIVDALKTINVDSSYNYRKKLAHKNGINNYHGSYSQNIKMLSLLKEGKLKKA